MWWCGVVCSVVRWESVVVGGPRLKAPARRLARATCGCVWKPLAQWFEGLVATKRKEADPGKWSEGPSHREWKWPPGAGDLRAPQLRNEWAWPLGGGGLGTPSYQTKIILARP